MNYLAHLFLANNSDEQRIGSILADFTNGTIDMLSSRFSHEIAKGIRHHRAIDKFTDEHPAVKRSVERLSSEYSIYSGIIVDVLFDHFLIIHWKRYSEIDQELFFESVYKSLSYGHFEYPERFSIMLERLLERKWLGVYRDLDSVAFALKKIDERFKRPTPLLYALKGIKKGYSDFETDFLQFFPQLKDFSDDFDTNF
ncbi:MAG: DUF479 domain-containing protein [Deltaproteobacteria bacterium]|nr:DUF479 domain-containing protein [Deltaproteobacteria bacterium]